MVGNPDVVGEVVGVEPKERGIARVSYTHDAMIDLVLAAGGNISQNDIAKHFGYTPSWISTIFNSDAFQSRLAARKEEIVDPLIRGQVDDAIKGLVTQSLAILREKLDNPNTQFNQALEVFKASTRAAGYGARTGSVNVNVNGQGSLIQILSGMDGAPPGEVGRRDTAGRVTGADTIDAEVLHEPRERAA